MSAGNAATAALMAGGWWWTATSTGVVTVFFTNAPAITTAYVFNLTAVG
jgi:hypothetical protein